MKCPVCQVILICDERQGIEIDYCPRCWGIWLDRGELNQLIAKALVGTEPAAAAREWPATSSR